MIDTIVQASGMAWHSGPERGNRLVTIHWNGLTAEHPSALAMASRSASGQDVRQSQ